MSCDQNLLYGKTVGLDTLSCDQNLLYGKTVGLDTLSCDQNYCTVRQWDWIH